MGGGGASSSSSRRFSGPMIFQSLTNLTNAGAEKEGPEGGWPIIDLKYVCM